MNKFFFCLLEVLATTGVRADSKLVIKGSDTLGAKLVPTLAEEYKAQHPGFSFEIAAEGSTTGITVSARLDAGQVQLHLQPVQLRAAVQETLDDFTLIARARGVVLESTVPVGLAAHADPDRLRQMISNLVDNVIKYGRPDGRVVVSGRALADGRVELGIRDNGPGIPAEATGRIFERFYRVDKARSREQGGTGLGLAIVKNVIQAHGGEVRVESTPGAGTEFFLVLPAAA
ncbi:MAG: hypothetical protein EXS32_11330 [Opitutus sp.]|nr:hypothetical protein [Opitutus sp.]